MLINSLSVITRSRLWGTSSRERLPLAFTTLVSRSAVICASNPDVPYVVLRLWTIGLTWSPSCQEVCEVMLSVSTPSMLKGCNKPFTVTVVP